jgi:hypothetical protein
VLLVFATLAVKGVVDCPAGVTRPEAGALMVTLTPAPIVTFATPNLDLSEVAIAIIWIEVIVEG